MASTSPRASNDREDSDWLLGIRAGDTAAFARLYTAYRSRLSRFVSRFVDSHETIGEIVNDSFMVVWFRAGDFRAESKVRIRLPMWNCRTGCSTRCGHSFPISGMPLFSDICMDIRFERYPR